MSDTDIDTQTKCPWVIVMLLGLGYDVNHIALAQPLGTAHYLWECGTGKFGTGPPVTFDSFMWHKSKCFIVITLRIVNNRDFLTSR